MKYKDVPDNHWVLYNMDTREVLFYDKDMIKVLKESEKYDVMKVAIEHKISNCYFIKSGYFA